MQPQNNILENTPYDCLFNNRIAPKYSNSVWEAKFNLVASIGIKSIHLRLICLINWSSAFVLSVFLSGAESVLQPSQSGKKISNDFSEVVVATAHLRRIIRCFPNNMEPIILQRETLFLRGKHFKMLSVFSQEGDPLTSP